MTMIPYFRKKRPATQTTQRFYNEERGRDWQQLTLVERTYRVDDAVSVFVFLKTQTDKKN